MKKPTGRRPNFPSAIMRIIGEKSGSREMTLRETSRVYRVSHGLVSDCKKSYGTHVPRFHDGFLEKLPRPMTAEKTAMESELKKFMRELSQLDQEIYKLERRRR